MASSTPVRLICPNLKCRAILTVPGDARGRQVRCRMCAIKILVPAHRPPTPKSAEAEGHKEPVHPG